MELIELRLGAPRYPVLNAFIREREAHVSVVRGPLGSGKTVGCVARAMLHMSQHPARDFGWRMERRSRGMVVRNTYVDLQETSIQDWLLLFRDGENGRMRWGNPPVYEVRMSLDDGTHISCDVVFLALDRTEDVRKAKGYQLDWIWLNEISELAKPIVDMLDLRHGRYRADLGESSGALNSWHGMFGDTNSYDSRHWLAKLEREQPKGWRFFVQPGGVIQDSEGAWQTNPAAENRHNLRQNYYERGMVGKDDSWIKVLLGNQIGFTVRGAPVHPRFGFDAHVAKRSLELDPRYELLLGLDFGRTPAAVLFQSLEHVGRYRVLDEFTTNDMSAALFGPELKRRIDGRWSEVRVRGWGDPAGDAQGQATESTPIEICRAAGLPIQPAPTNNWALRRASLDNVLMRLASDKRPALEIDPRCEALIQALMGGYHYRELQVGGPERRYGELPEKNDSSHIAESLHYGLLGAGEGRAALQPAEPQLRRQRRPAAERYSELAW